MQREVRGPGTGNVFTVRYIFNAFCIDQTHSGIYERVLFAYFEVRISPLREDTGQGFADKAAWKARPNDFSC